MWYIIKVVPVCSMKAYGGSTSIAPLIRLGIG
jgi:hypothetical protein